MSLFQPQVDMHVANISSNSLSFRLAFFASKYLHADFTLLHSDLALLLLTTSIKYTYCSTALRFIKLFIFIFALKTVT